MDNTGMFPFIINSLRKLAVMVFTIQLEVLKKYKAIQLVS